MRDICDDSENIIFSDEENSSNQSKSLKKRKTHYYDN